MCMSGFARIALFVVNFALWLAGAAILAVGVWMKVDATIVNYLHVVNVHQSDPLIDHAAMIFIIVGGIVLIVGFVGCLGALRKSQLLLFIYAALIIVAMIAQISASVLALLYKMKVEEHLVASMTAQIKTKYTSGATKFAWDYLQVKLSCCGATNYTDFDNSVWSNSTRNNTDFVPVACCVLEKKDYKNPVAKDNFACQSDAQQNRNQSQQLHMEGCADALLDWFSSKTLMLLIIAFTVAFIQMLCIAAACWLRGAIKRDIPTKA